MILYWKWLSKNEIICLVASNSFLLKIIQNILSKYLQYFYFLHFIHCYYTKINLCWLTFVNFFFFLQKCMDSLQDKSFLTFNLIRNPKIHPFGGKFFSHEVYLPKKKICSLQLNFSFLGNCLLGLDLLLRSIEIYLWI